MTLELKPCPFCGKAPKWNSRPASDIGQVFCASVGCFGPKTTALSKVDSAHQWNTRAEAAGEQHLQKIILGLFNPMPDQHAKGCLTNENGPCICGYSEVAGRYLWALREAKKIAAEHYGYDKVVKAQRLQEPPALVEAAAHAGHRD